MLTLMPGQTIAFDHDAAAREGWDVFDCGPDPNGRPQRQLQRIDASEDGTPPFADDRDAWQHVVTRARRVGAAPRRARSHRRRRARADRGGVRRLIALSIPATPPIDGDQPWPAASTGQGRRSRF